MDFLCDNASHNIVTETEWRIEGEDRASGLVIAVFLILFMLIGLPWNLLMIVTIVKERLYRQPTTILLLNLALSDVLMLLLIIPLDIVTGLTGEFHYGNSDYVRCSVCRSHHFFTGIFFDSTLVSIVMLSLDRFMFIYKPLRYDNIITAKRATLAVVIVWTVSIAERLVPIVTLEKPTFSPQFLTCIWGDSTTIYIIIWHIFCLSLNLVILLVCNSYVVYIVQRNIRAIYRVQRSFTTDTEKKSHQEKLNLKIRRSRHKKQLHLIRVFGSLFTSNLITLLPFALLSIIVEFTRDIPVEVTAVANILFLSNVAIHPILETMLIRDIREPMKKMAFFCCLESNISNHKVIKSLEKSFSHVCSVVSTLNCSCRCGFFDVCSAAVLDFEDSNQSSTQ